MATPKQQYIKQLNNVAARHGKLEDETIRRMLAMLKELRRDIADLVLQTKDFERFRLQHLKQNIGTLIGQFEQSLGSNVRTAMGQAAEFGSLSVAEPMAALGFKIETAAWFRPVPAQVNVALDYSAELIHNIVEPMRASINKQLQLALLGQKKPLDAMREITKILGVEARTGVWKKVPDPVSGIAARAEADVRTEMQRMFNLSNHSQQMAVAEMVPGVTKRWVATGDLRTRRSHLLAHIKYKNNPIPIDQPFILSPTKGKNRGRQFKLMYPLDPNGPPELVINCRCKMATIHPQIGVIGSSLDGRIAAELTRRGVAYDV